MTNSIQSIPLDKLVAHPDNPNRMSEAVFRKLVRNIERSGRYEPLIVRPYPNKSKTAATAKTGVQKDDDAMDSRLRGNDIKRTGDCFQIINGEHRCRALAKLGYKQADCIIWDVDDEQTDILLATLNRLCGSDESGKKPAILKRLVGKTKTSELAKLLPHTAKRIERFTSLKMPTVPAEMKGERFAEPMVFFVNDSQQGVIENALSLVQKLRSEKTKASRRAAALSQIAEYFLSGCVRAERPDESARGG